MENDPCMYLVYKQLGETPLHCMRRLFDTSTVSYTYAGRLDPLADGLLLILSDDECRHAPQLYHLTKTYTFTYAVGIATDSYDCLGRIQQVAPVGSDVVGRITTATKKLQGTVTLPYPSYSSKTVHGVPLHVHARRGTLHRIPLPTKTTTILSHHITATWWSRRQSIQQYALQCVPRVRGDFRQQDILNDWKNLLDDDLYLVRATVTASGGTYVRALVHEIGSLTGYPTTAIRITRTAIGPFGISDVTTPPSLIPLHLPPPS